MAENHIQSPDILSPLLNPKTKWIELICSDNVKSSTHTSSHTLSSFSSSIILFEFIYNVAK